MRLVALFAALLALLAQSPAADPPKKEKEEPAPAGKVANPSYKSWAKHPKGTVVTLKTASDTAGQKSEAVMTLTLLDLTPEKAVIEMVNVAKAAGREVKSPALKQELKRYVDLPLGSKGAEAKKPDGVVEQSDKVVTVGGKEYKAKYTKVRQKAGGADVVAEVWASDDVPGMILKSVNVVTGPFPTNSTLELVEVKRPDDGKKPAEKK